MKILESYKKIAKSMLIEHAWDRKFGESLPTLEDVMREAEVDDDEMIKYKDKDGEQKQMKAGSAKTMPKDHPAKQAWDKLADKGGEEEPKGKGLEPDDFERDFDPEKPEDEPSDMDTEKPDDEGPSEEQLQKDTEMDMFSFSKVIARVLKTYIKDGTVPGMTVCENCSAEDTLRYQEGCVTCTSCGNGKCG